MSEVTPRAPPRSDDHCDGWPGIAEGARAPYCGEVQLSWAEVYYGLVADLIGLDAPVTS
jgi:hypothetical protein